MCEGMLFTCVLLALLDDLEGFWRGPCRPAAECTACYLEWD